MLSRRQISSQSVKEDPLDLIIPGLETSSLVEVTRMMESLMKVMARAKQDQSLTFKKPSLKTLTMILSLRTRMMTFLLSSSGQNISQTQNLRK